MTELHQFTVSGDLLPDEYKRENEGKKDAWLFTQDLRWLFPQCESNDEVEAKLRYNGVIHHSNVTDTEYAQFFIYFSNWLSGKNFIDRFNAYLTLRHATQEEEEQDECVQL